MDAYIFHAALYCSPCGERLQTSLRDQGRSPSEDSDAWPQGPVPNGGGEADSPQHCDNCDVFLENPLTEEGRRYVRMQLVRYPTPIYGLLATWCDFYGDTLRTSRRDFYGDTLRTSRRAPEAGDLDCPLCQQNVKELADEVHANDNGREYRAIKFACPDGHTFTMPNE